MPATSRTATDTNAVVENRLSKADGHPVSAREDATRIKCRSPPIHTPAASWCRASRNMSPARGPSRPAAWLVHAVPTPRSTVSPASAIHQPRRSGRLARAAHPITSPAQDRIRTAPALKKLVRATSAIGQPEPASAKTESWTPRESSCAAATTAAPPAVSRRLFARRARAGAPSGSAGRSCISAKSTPPMATACPHRASPRRRTSTNPATASSGAPPRPDPEKEKEEDRRADGRQHQEHVGLAEGRERDHQIDEIAVGERFGEARDPRGVGADRRIEHEGARLGCGGAERRDDRDRAER